MDDSKNNIIKNMRLLLTAQIIVGLIACIIIASFVGVIATGPPTSTLMAAVTIAGITFIVFALPFCVLPYFAMQEVNNFLKRDRLILSSINISIIFLCSIYYLSTLPFDTSAIQIWPILVLLFFIIAVAQIYQLSRLLKKR